MNRFEQTFQHLKEKNRKAFVPYFMAGDGGLGCLVERLITLEKFGASVIEVGVPFSDPVADGPTIQEAGIRALKNGTTLRGIITELATARQKVTVPIVLMTYLNPIFSYGVDEFVKDMREAGVDGCIIPDLPIEEEEIIAPLLNKAGVELIRLVTLTTPMERIKVIASKGKGFLYTVTVKGTTGTRQSFDNELGEFLENVKAVSPIPVLAGFGISSGQQIIEVSSYCDGVIAGSKIVNLFANNDLLGLEGFMSALQPEKNLH